VAATTIATNEWSKSVAERQRLELESSRWYAVLTRARHEKRVAYQLEQRCIEHFFPVYTSLRRWKDRRIQLVLPLFPSYLFVCIPITERLRVLQVTGVAKLVGFGGHATPLPQQDITRIQQLLSRGVQPRPHPYLYKGRRVRVLHGPLQGMDGLIIRRKGSARFILSMDFIHRSISVELDEPVLQPVVGEAMPIRGAHRNG
jgi:transcription antitermination factor NusG